MIYRFGNLLSASRQMADLFELANRAASSNVPILITGESGTGKGLMAQAIHDCSPRRGANFVAENCAAIPESLLENELFGHAQGAFTGAVRQSQGLLEIADRGTMFLDEIGDMPLTMQVKLLRILETGKIRQLGAMAWKKVDVRFISATHWKLEDLVQKGKFREDLLYRLRVVVIEIPPLRERRDDITILCEHFLASLPQARDRGFSFTPSAREALSEYHWPGNVRQLRHEIEKIVALKREHGPIGRHELSPEITGSRIMSIPPSLSLREATQMFEHNYVQQTIRQSSGNKTIAANLLGISRRSLYNKLGRVSEQHVVKL